MVFYHANRLQDNRGSIGVPKGEIFKFPRNSRNEGFTVKRTIEIKQRYSGLSL